MEGCAGQDDQDVGDLVRDSAICPFCQMEFDFDTAASHSMNCVDMEGWRLETDDFYEASKAGEVQHTDKKDSGGVLHLVRAKVSLNKKRYQEEGFNLDLSYITNTVIAMGFPSHGTQGYFRNPAEEVHKFFESRHAGKYKVYNLCSERQYSDANLFHGSHETFPFDDHNPPPLELIPKFCENVEQWLKKGEKQVIAVHCKAGKGRTGVMIACYLMSSRRELRKATDALNFFADARTHDGQGCTIPSQHRFCWYWEQCLSQHGGVVPPAPVLLLQTLVVNTSITKSGNVPDLYFVVVNGYKKDILFDSRKSTISNKVPFKDGKYSFNLQQLTIRMMGDIKFVFYDSGYLRDDHLFHFWIQTGYTPHEFALGKFQLDKACKDTKDKNYDENLKVEVKLTSLS